MNRTTPGCKGYEETIRTPPVPAQPIPKSNATAGLLAYIAVAKYHDALRLARQEKILQPAGFDIPRATLAGWMIKLAELLAPMIVRLRACLLELAESFSTFGVQAEIGLIRNTLTGPWLDPEEIEQRIY